MKHEWHAFLGCAETCRYCGIRRHDAKSAYCSKSDIAARWVQTFDDSLRDESEEQPDRTESDGS